MGKRKIELKICRHNRQFGKHRQDQQTIVTSTLFLYIYRYISTSYAGEVKNAMSNSISLIYIINFCLPWVFCFFFLSRVGKTTVCQLYAAMQGQTLYAINCHMHTESADFIGGLRPVRSHEDSVSCCVFANFEIEWWW